MFDISFSRNGDEKCTQVITKIATDLNVEKSLLYFTFECGHQYAAELLRLHLEKTYHDSIQTAHRAAYEQGYKDGRGKKRKKTLFYRSFQKDGICCL